MSILQMTTPFGLAGVAAKATLLLVIGWCCTLLLRRSSAVARHLVWLTVIVGVLLIPVLVNLAPMQVAMLPSVAAKPPVTFNGPTSPDARAATGATLIDAQPARATNSAVDSPRSWTPSVGTLVVALWITITVAFLSRLLVGMLSVARIIRSGRSLQSIEWARALASAATQLELAPPRLVMSDQVEMAFAFDAFTPTIIVPVSAREWSEDRRRAVLLHELAHIRRHDLIAHIVASIACAVYWFNPFVWVAARRLRVESELATDDVVLASGVRPADYAQHLLDMVMSVGRQAPTVALAMARPKDFEGRLVAILDRANRRRVLGKAQGRALIALLGLMTVSIAAVVPVSRSRQAPSIVPTTGAATPSTTPALPPLDSLSAKESASTADASRTKVVAAGSRRAAALSDVAIASLLRYGPAAVINPMMMLLRGADSLHLNGKQADSLATLNRWYMVHLNAIWSPVSNYYVSHPRTSNETSINAPFREAPRASMDLLIGIVPDISGLLSDDQRRTLPAGIATYLDPGHLAAIGAGETDAPGGVFLPAGGPFGRAGARVGGGGRQ